jgi:hypothetical protein
MVANFRRNIYQVEYLRNRINELLISSKEARLIKGYLNWNNAVTIHIDSLKNRRQIQGIDQDIYQIMSDLIHELYIKV